MRIAIVSNISNGVGLELDVRILERIAKRAGHTVVKVQFTGPMIAERFDLAIFVEICEPRFFKLAPIRWLIPNPEWWFADNNRYLGEFSRVLCKTEDARRIFEGLGTRAIYVGFTSDDHHDPAAARVREFLHIAGDSTFKGSPAVLDAWERFKIPYPLTVVSRRQSLRTTVRGVRFRRRVSSDEIQALQNRCLFNLAPSEYEGFGHVINEALSVGAIVATTDSPPMNEFDGATFRIPSASAWRHELATCGTVTPEAVRDVVEAMWAMDEAAVAEASRKAREDYLQRSTAFEATFEVLLEGAAVEVIPPRVEPAAEVKLPRVAICFPAHISNAEHVRRSVYALRAQTVDPSMFEVVIAADGGDSNGVIAAAVQPASHPFSVKIVDSPRPRGNVPHRNHARNAAWQAATASLCAMFDCDFCLAPTFIEHLLVEHDAAVLRGYPAVFTPVMLAFGSNTEDWLTRSSPWVDGGDGAQFARLLAEWPQFDTDVYSGFPDLLAPGPPLSRPAGPLPEGQPILWRELLAAMGGFDERLGQWGDDKVEFMDRLQALAALGFFQIRLLRSSAAYHQPHVKDPEAWSRSALPRQQYRHDHLMQISKRTQWWRDRVTDVQTAMSTILQSIGPIQSATQSITVDDLRGIAEQSTTASQVRGILDAVVLLAGERLKGHRGKVVVLGPHQKLLAELLGAAGLQAAAHQDGEPVDRMVSVLVGVDVFAGQPIDEAAGRRVRSIIASGTAIVLAEVTTLGMGARSGYPHPIQIQRVLSGASVKKSIPAIDGRVYTIFAGRIRGS